MFVGAVFGARFAIRLGNLWLRRIFLTATWALGLKALVFDVFSKASGARRRRPLRTRNCSPSRGSDSRSHR
jgi:uncharacterized membrane protein YfcA